MFTVYVLKSLISDRMYVGFTEEIEKRLKNHNSGKVRSTKAYKPYSLVYKEERETRIKAREREIFLKTGKGREYLKSVVK